MGKPKIRYVQLEAEAFLSDIDFQLMSAEERGVYCSIILYLYANGGTLAFTNSKAMAVLCGCYKTGNDWELIWEKLKHKFIINNGLISHKRVVEELKSAEDFLRTRQQAGRKGAQIRWSKIAPPMVNYSKGKVSKEKERIYIYTIEQVKDACIVNGIPGSEAQEYYNHYGSQGFKKANDQPITNLQLHIAESWAKDKNCWRWLEKKKQTSSIQQQDEKAIRQERQRIREETEGWLRDKNDQALKDLLRDKTASVSYGWLIREILNERRKAK